MKLRHVPQTLRLLCVSSAGRRVTLGPTARILQRKTRKAKVRQTLEKATLEKPAPGKVSRREKAKALTQLRRGLVRKGRCLSWQKVKKRSM